MNCQIFFEIKNIKGLRLFLDFVFFSKNKTKTRKLQINVSQRIMVKSVQEVVRLKAENPCFNKKK